MNKQVKDWRFFISFPPLGSCRYFWKCFQCDVTDHVTWRNTLSRTLAAPEEVSLPAASVYCVGCFKMHECSYSSLSLSKRPFMSPWKRSEPPVVKVLERSGGWCAWDSPKSDWRTLPSHPPQNSWFTVEDNKKKQVTSYSLHSLVQWTIYIHSMLWKPLPLTYSSLSKKKKILTN